MPSRDTLSKWLGRISNALTTALPSCEPRETMALIFIRICAVLIGLRALTNFGKLLQPTESVLVFFGQILHDGAVPVPACAVGLFMLVTAITMWKPLKLAAPLVTAYALYV